MHTDTTIKEQKTRIRKRAMDLLARREHSFHELRRKLRRRFSEEISEEALDEAIQRLADQGLQSDQRFAESYLRLRVGAGFGPQRIRLELRERGVDEDMVSQVIAQCDEDWLARACAVYEKKFGHTLAEGPRELAKRQRFLHYRGFSPELIRQVLDE